MIHDFGTSCIDCGKGIKRIGPVCGGCGSDAEIVDEELYCPKCCPRPEWVKEPPTEPGVFRVLLGHGRETILQWIEVDGELCPPGQFEFGTRFDHRVIEFLEHPAPEKIGDCIQCSNVIMDNERSWQMRTGDDKSWLCVNCARENIDFANKASAQEARERNAKT